MSLSRSVSVVRGAGGRHCALNPFKMRAFSSYLVRACGHRECTQRSEYLRL